MAQLHRLNTVVRARLDDETKQRAEKTLAELGITTSAVIQLLFDYIAAENALPQGLRGRRRRRARTK